MRTTDEESGDHRVYAAKGDTPVKGVALHQDIIAELNGEPDFIAVEFSDDGAIDLTPASATSATVKFDHQPAVRHIYADPTFVSEFGDFTFDGGDTDLDTVPTLGIESIVSSDETTYDSALGTSAEEAVEALFAEQEAVEDIDEDEVEISDEDIGLVN
jgi:hypothetical protein